MRRVLVVTWALGTASGVLLGLFGVQLVSSRFSTARVSPLSHPEVLRALQAARSVPVATETEVAAPASPPDTATPPTSTPTDAASARPSAESTSTPVPASPASSLPRPGAAAGTLVETAAAPSSSSTTTTVAPVEPSSTSTTATTVKPDSKTRAKTESDSKKTNRSSTTTTTERKTTTTTSQSSKSGRTQTRTLSSRGGLVTVKWLSDGTVRIDVARPNAGYEMRVSSNGPDQVVVYFWKQGRVSEVKAWYQNGSPTSKVTEWECSGSYPNIRCRER